MTTAVQNLKWQRPWKSLHDSQDLPLIQYQVENELSDGPLWGKRAEVVGRRVDNDDVLVTFRDGGFAIIHLTWNRGPRADRSEYPSARIHESVAAVQKVIDLDAAAYSDD